MRTAAASPYGWVLQRVASSILARRIVSPPFRSIELLESAPVFTKKSHRHPIAQITVSSQPVGREGCARGPSSSCSSPHDLRSSDRQLARHAISTFGQPPHRARAPRRGPRDWPPGGGRPAPGLRRRASGWRTMALRFRSAHGLDDANGRIFLEGPQMLRCQRCRRGPAKPDARSCLPAGGVAFEQVGDHGGVPVQAGATAPSARLRQKRPPKNRTGNRQAPPCARGASMVTAKALNVVRAASTQHPGRLDQNRALGADCQALAARLAWVSITPFGICPVVPELSAVSDVPGPAQSATTHEQPAIRVRQHIAHSAPGCDKQVDRVHTIAAVHGDRASYAAGYCKPIGAFTSITVSAATGHGRDSQCRHGCGSRLPVGRADACCACSVRRRRPHRAAAWPAARSAYGWLGRGRAHCRTNAWPEKIRAEDCPLRWARLGNRHVNACDVLSRKRQPVVEAAARGDAMRLIDDDARHFSAAPSASARSGTRCAGQRMAGAFVVINAFHDACRGLKSGSGYRPSAPLSFSPEKRIGHGRCRSSSTIRMAMAGSQRKASGHGSRHVAQRQAVRMAAAAICRSPRRQLFVLANHALQARLSAGSSSTATARLKLCQQGRCALPHHHEDVLRRANCVALIEDLERTMRLAASFGRRGLVDDARHIARTTP
ncbi:hypothetical protein FQR65_LT20767 [Abscondita terminalis]|nr:hypothetical protein FQR65_LT20767 [Abscondita terminalis]